MRLKKKIVDYDKNSQRNHHGLNDVKKKRADGAKDVSHGTSVMQDGIIGKY